VASSPSRETTALLYGVGFLLALELVAPDPDRRSRIARPTWTGYDVDRGVCSSSSTPSRSSSHPHGFIAIATLPLSSRPNVLGLGALRQRVLRASDVAIGKVRFSFEITVAEGEVAISR
jgi:hypothetical protein